MLQCNVTLGIGGIIPTRFGIVLPGLFCYNVAYSPEHRVAVALVKVADRLGWIAS